MKPLGFLDNDCTIGWPIDQNIGMQIVIAKPKSRFLKLWLQSYQDYSNYLSIVFNKPNLFLATFHFIQ